MGQPRVKVFVARSSADEERIEAVLAREGIEWFTTLAPSDEIEESAVCFLSMVYEVAAGDADRALSAIRILGTS